MSHKRELMDDARGPVFMELEGNALTFQVFMERRSGILVELSTPGGADSEEARLIDAATLGGTRKGSKLTIPVPQSVVMVNRRGFRNSVTVTGNVSYGDVIVGNVVQFGSSSFGRGGSNGLVLNHGIDVTVYLPQDSDVLIERGGGLLISGRAGLIEADFSGGDVIFDEANELRIRTSGGDIRGEFVAQLAQAHTSGGNIKIGVTRGEADLETSGGNVSIGEAYGSGRMRTSGGNVKLGSFYGESMKMRTSGGNINHPEHPGISARTSGGRINGKSPRW